MLNNKVIVSRIENKEKKHQLTAASFCIQNWSTKDHLFLIFFQVEIKPSLELLMKNT